MEVNVSVFVSVCEANDIVQLRASDFVRRIFLVRNVGILEYSYGLVYICMAWSFWVL